MLEASQISCLNKIYDRRSIEDKKSAIIASPSKGQKLRDKSLSKIAFNGPDAIHFCTCIKIVTTVKKQQLGRWVISTN